MRFNTKQLAKLRNKSTHTCMEETELNIGHWTTMYAFSIFASLCDYLVVRGEASAGSRPGDLGRRISGSKTVELQTLALLDISYRWLDADR